MKKLIAFLVILLVSAAVISAAVVSGAAVFSAEQVDIVSFRGFTLRGVDLGENDYSTASDTLTVLTILSDKPMTISGTSLSDGSDTAETRIVIDSPNGANLTLSDLNIWLNQTVGVGNPSAAFGITPNTGTVKITLVGDNTLRSGPGHAGLENNSVPVEINGDGSLFAEGFEGGAGIGGGKGKNGENITINGGTIYARSAVKSIAVNTSDEGGGAGIGGGCGGKGSNITITRGTVRAIGIAGAGIGGGLGGDGEDITITDGKVYAKTTTVNRGKHGESAGIGGGCGGNARNITISGGKVLAKTKTEHDTIYNDDNEDFDYLFETSTHSVGDGAAIGGGAYCDDLKTGGSCENIVIKDTANVRAFGGVNGAAIGGGKGGSCGGKDENGNDIPGVTIQLSEDGSVYTYVQHGAAIGGGQSGNGENINISGSGKLTIKSGYGAGIGGGDGGDGKNIDISGEVNINIDFGDGAGIGGGSGGDGSNITIALNDEDDKKGHLTITPSYSATGAGIGGGYGGNGSYIAISGGDINITSKSGAGIGGGGASTDYYHGYPPTISGGNGSGITISGGQILVESSSGAGIGGGASQFFGSSVIENGNGSNIVITGGSVNATSSGGSGIGGGVCGNGSDITISGGSVTASGSTGIGGGQFQGGGGGATDITISGKATTVNATGKGGAGIGGQGNGVVSGIEISGDVNVTATGEKSGVGIGGNNCSDITINGGNVTATTVYSTYTYTYQGEERTTIYQSPGINAENVTVNGDSTVVNATGSGKCAGINGTNITITDGTVTAEGGKEIEDGGSGISADEIILGNNENATYPLIYTNEIKGTVENESGDLAIVFNIEKTEGTVYGGTVTLTKDPIAGTPCKKLTVKSGATLVTNNNLTLNDGVVLYLETNAHLNKYNSIIMNGGEIQHEDGSLYVDKDAEAEVSLFADEGYGNTVCDICGKPEPHDWDVDNWENDNNFHWHECNFAQLHDCAVEPNQLKTCSITDNSKKFGYGAHNYNFDDPKYDETENKLYYLCQDCNYKLSLEIPEIKLVKVDNNDAPLENAEFGLYTDAGCTTLYTSAVIPNVSSTGTTAIADGEAVVSFFAEPGKSYYIKELTAPEGYIASTKVYKAVIDETGEVTYSIVGTDGTLDDVPVCKNILQGSVSIKIAKVDATTNNPLVGAEFTLYGNEDFTVTITTETTAMEDGKAVASFAVDPGAMTYYIKETKAPEGYIVSDKVYKAVVDENGKVTYSIVGTDGTSEDVLVCENTKTTPPQEDPTNPADPTDPTTSTTPTTPITPTNPTTPTTPTKPTDPTASTDSTTSAQPSNPSDTSNASDTDDKSVPDDTQSNPSTGVAGTLNLVILSVGVCAAFLAKKAQGNKKQ